MHKKTNAQTMQKMKEIENLNQQLDTKLISPMEFVELVQNYISYRASELAF